MEEVITEQEIRYNGKTIEKNTVITDAPTFLKQRWLKNGVVSQYSPSRETATDKSIESRETATEKPTGYKVEHQGDGGYDVINLETGKPVNKTSKRKSEAKKIKNELENK